MQNKYFYAIIIILFLISIDCAVSAESTDSVWSSWAHYTFFEPLNTGARSNTFMNFYPVENWEIEVCTKDLTSMKSRSDRSATSPDTARLWYDGASIAIYATKNTYASGDVIYNVDWFIDPKDYNIKFTLYFKDDDGKRVNIEGYKDVVIDKESYSKAISKYFNKTYVIVGLEYVELDEYEEIFSQEYLETDFIEQTGVTYG